MRHSNTIATIALITGLLTLTGGCFATKVRSGSTRPDAPMHEDRQWFTASGLVTLSDEGGQECGDAGTSYVESRQSITDVLLGVLVGAGAAGVGFALCDSADAEEYASCVVGASSVGPVLLGSRTVRYQCNGGGGASARLEAIPPATGR